MQGGRAWKPEELIAESPEELVQRQVNAYNLHDLEAFLATYSEDVEVFVPPHRPAYQGRQALEERFVQFFAQAPNVHARIGDRLLSGRYVIDREHVTGLPDGAKVEAVAVYEVVEGLIRRVWFLPGR